MEAFSVPSSCAGDLYCNRNPHETWTMKSQFIWYKSLVITIPMMQEPCSQEPREPNSAPPSKLSRPCRGGGSACDIRGKGIKYNANVQIMYAIYIKVSNRYAHVQIMGPCIPNQGIKAYLCTHQYHSDITARHQFIWKVSSTDNAGDTALHMACQANRCI